MKSLRFKLTFGAFLLALGATLHSAPAAAQSDILLRLRSGSPLGDRMRVDSAGGVIAIGELGIGIIPFSGEGYRMMWYPFKASFRAGHADNEWDDANNGFFSWAGGNNTTASQYATFAFGDNSDATANYAVAFGQGVQASDSHAFAVGLNSRCSGLRCVAMGDGVNAAGDYSIALGYRSTADANYSVAIGQRASTNGRTGAIVFADQSTTDSIEAAANNEFAVRAAGGFRFRTNATLTTGCNLAAGSNTFVCPSSFTLKENFEPVDGEELLARFRAVPVNFWNVIEEVGKPRRIGPFAEDFYAAFGVGNDPMAIAMQDIDGVNFAAIRALEARTAELRTRTAELHERTAEVARLRTDLDATRRELDELRAAVRRLQEPQR